MGAIIAGGAAARRAIIVGVFTRALRRTHRALRPPSELGVHEGLSYALFLPRTDTPCARLVVLHGADSSKESHFHYARAAAAQGFAAAVFDQRGHGASEGALGDGTAADIAAIASLLPPGPPLTLRGSSMGGYLALVCAAQTGAQAVVAICPASAEGLARGLRGGRFGFSADVPALERFLAANDELDAVAQLDVPLLLMHAEGDTVVPPEHSRELADVAPQARLIAVPGGDHRSVQGDHELSGESLRFLARAVRAQSV